MYTDFNENNIYYDIFGEGKNYILLLHGWGCSGKIFDPVISLLNKKYKFIVVDFNGHGRSPEPQKTFYVKDFAEVIYNLLLSLNIDKINIIAHSFGARVAIFLASQHPKLVSKMIITGGAGIILNRNKRFNLKNLSYKFQKNFLNIFRKVNLFNKQIDNLQEALIQKYGSDDYKVLSPGMRKTFIAVVNQDLTSYLKNIVASTLLIWGNKDTETPIEYAIIMNDNIEDSAIITFENMGHFAFLEDVQRFVAITDNFFSEEWSWSIYY